jgi:DNA-binding NarL/FixJ family response regulator
VDVPVDGDAAMIRFILVDDHAMFSEGIVLLLSGEDDLELLASVGSAEAGLDACRQHHPDVVVLDLDLPDSEGVTTIQDLREAEPSAQILVLSGSTDPRTIARSFEAGAVGYLGKAFSGDHLAEAIRRAASGQVWMPQGDFSSVFANLRSEREEERRQESLTPREYEVLRLLASGVSVPEAASTLHISVYTLRGHVRSLLRKLEVGSIAQAVAFAWRAGMVDRDR